jgi:hypothetical protein
VIDQSRDDVVRACKAYLDDLYELGRFPDPLGNREERYIGSEGIVYTEGDTPEFKAMLSYFEERSASLLKESLPAKGLELLQIMEGDVQDFFRRLCLNNVTSSPYFDVPVLAHVAPEQFVERLLALKPAAQRSVFFMFRGRYERGQLDETLKEERPWLAEVKRNLEGRIEAMRPMSRYRIRRLMARNLDPLLSHGEPPRVVCSLMPCRLATTTRRSHSSMPVPRSRECRVRRRRKFRSLTFEGICRPHSSSAPPISAR